MCTQPVRDLGRDALRTIVTFHRPRRAALSEPLREPLDDVTRRERAGAVTGQPFTGLLIQPRQAVQPSSLGGGVVDKIVAPDMVGMRRPGRHSRVRPDGAPLARFLDHWESLARPKAAHRVATHRPLFGLQQGKHLALPKPWRALRAGMNTGDQRRPLRLTWLPTLGPAMHGPHPAGAPFAHTVRLLQRSRRTALGSQAHHFFPRTSCSIRWSRVSAPTSRFSAAFSRSSARSCLASEPSIPPHCRRHRSSVCSAIFWWRQTSRTCPRASASGNIRIICSAENRLRFLRPPVDMS
jgi:hypothetical protein